MKRLASFLPVATGGCFGNFELTQKVWRFNRDVDDDKWVQEIVFLLLAIVPIYGGAAILDVVVFNSFEFWTGDNPVMASNGDRQVIETEQGEVVLTRVDERTLEVVFTAVDGRKENLTLVREADSFAARDRAGSLIARVASVNGRPAIVARGR